MGRNIEQTVDNILIIFVLVVMGRYYNSILTQLIGVLCVKGQVVVLLGVILYLIIASHIYYILGGLIINQNSIPSLFKKIYTRKKIVWVSLASVVIIAIGGLASYLLHNCNLVGGTAYIIIDEGINAAADIMGKLVLIFVLTGNWKFLKGKTPILFIIGIAGWHIYQKYQVRINLDINNLVDVIQTEETKGHIINRMYILTNILYGFLIYRENKLSKISMKTYCD